MHVGLFADTLLFAQDDPARLIPSWHPFKKAVTPAVPVALLFWAER
jgi:hypothetical protein